MRLPFGWISLILLVSQAAASEQIGAYQRTIAARGPAAVQISDAGLIYVLEQDRHRVRVFDASGAPVRAFGRFGNRPGQLQRPSDLALAPDGSVFVLDAGNQRVVHFDSGGTAQSAWGDFGDQLGQFRNPQGIAVAGGQVYVADTDNHRIQIFDVQGQHVHSIGSYGQQPGQFIEPVAVVVDSDGTLYVAEAGNSRVQVFDADHNRVGQIGDWGFFPGMFSGPQSVALHNGQLFVVDEGNHRVQVFDRKGDLQYEFGLHALKPRQGEGHLHYPDSLAIAPDGSIAIVGEYFEDRLQVFGTETAEEAERRRRIFRPVMSAAAPHFGQRCDVQDELMVIPSRDAHQVLLFDVRPTDPILVHTFGRLGTEAGRFLAPGAVALAPGCQRLLVGDTGNRRLSAFALQHDPKAEIKHRPNFSRLARSLDWSSLADKTGIAGTALARAQDGTIFVLNAAVPEVVQLDGDWKPMHRFGSYGIEDGQFRGPSDLTLSHDGTRLYVVDAGNQRVQSFAVDGTHLASFGGYGKREGQFLQPFGIAAAPDGTVFVTDVDLNRVAAFDADGKPLHSWGGRGLQAGQFLRPRGIDVDPQGRVFVLDHGNHRVQVFNARGSFERAFGPRLYVAPTRGANTEED